MTAKIKNIIIFSGIALAFILIYIFFIRSSAPEASLVSSGANTTLPNIDGTIPGVDATSTNPLVAKDFLVLLSNVKNIKLDDTIFSDPAFNSLHDSSITLIPDGTEGRPNPFAQFGNDALPVLNTQNNLTTTPLSNITTPPITPVVPPAPTKSTTKSTKITPAPAKP